MGLSYEEHTQSRAWELSSEGSQSIAEVSATPLSCIPWGMVNDCVLLASQIQPHPLASLSHMGELCGLPGGLARFCQAGPQTSSAFLSSAELCGEG